MSTVQEALDNLYFTRAVLSKISVEKDKIEELKVKRKNSEKEANEKTARDSAEMKKIKNEIKNEMKDIDQRISKINDEEIPKLNQSIDAVGTDRDPVAMLFIMILSSLIALPSFFLGLWWVNSGFNFFVGCLFFPITVASALIVIVVAITSKDLYIVLAPIASLLGAFWIKFNFHIGWGIPFFVCILLLIAIFIITIVNSKNGKVYSSDEEERRRYQKQIADLEITKRSLVLKKESAYNRLKELEKGETVYYFAEATEFKNEIALRIAKAKDLYECARTTAIIDERDFPHIDVIIYELETGRADTLKEALQQADLHVRHGEIKSIMYSATQMICSSIQSSSNKLARTMDLQLSRLNAEIADLNSTQRELSSKFDESIKSQELTNSLLQKANVSSESLAYDAARIKELNERAYYGH